MRKITQKMVAARFGVSPAIISYILHDPDTRRVAEVTRERILAFMKEEAPYLLRPRSESKPDICFLLPQRVTGLDCDEKLYAPALHGIELLASQGGYSVIFNRYQQEEDISRLLSSRRFGGIVVFYDPHCDVQRLAADNCPVVIINSPCASPHCDTVQVASTSMVRNAVAYLHRCGHQRIACVQPELHHPTGINLVSQRLAGYYEGLTAMGLPIVPDYIQNVILLETPAGRPDVYSTRAVLKHLMQLPEPPTALIAFNDYIALQVMRTAQIDLNMTLPNDLSVIGFDDIEAAQMSMPALTTIRQDGEKMGRVAVNLLLARMSASILFEDFLHCTVESELILRDSVAVLE